jgi:hypothetical protein
VTGVTVFLSPGKHHGYASPHRERTVKRAIIVAVLGLALAASVFVEMSTYEEIVSIADASIDAGPAF